MKINFRKLFMNNHIFDVTGLGSLAVDLIGSIDAWPELGTKNPFSAFDIYDGGLTGTALTAVSRLGGKASYIGKLGKSDMAVRAYRSLEQEGIDLSNTIRDDITEPIISFVLSSRINDHRNIFFKKNNLNFPFQNEIPDKYWYKKTKLLFTDHVAGEAGLEAVKTANRNQLPVVVDIERIQENTEDLLKFSNHIIVSEEFARLFSGTEKSDNQFKALRKNNFQSIIITRGKNGCMVSHNNEILNIPGIKVQVADTTGCGDTFHGAYALEIARGKDIFTAAKTANIVAAMCAMSVGGRTGIPDSKLLKEFSRSLKEYQS